MKPISHSTLIELAGKAAYKRGEDYYRNGHVGELRIKGNTITAEVEGTEVYRVSLKHTPRVFEGSCDCPASEGFDFCKHCVATALVYLEQLQTKEQLYDSKGEDLLKNYLLSLDKTKLARQLQELIEDDKLLSDKWMLKAQAAAGKLDHKAFKKSITRAIPYNRNLYRYAEVRKYFAGVETVVDKLAEFAPHMDAKQTILLIDYGLQRINKALESVDDSGGFRYHSVETLGELHRQTLSRIDWTPQKLAGYLLEIYMSESDDLYPDIPEQYTDVINEEALERFNAELQVQWDKLPPLSPDDTGINFNWNRKWRYLRIQRPLLAVAERDGDVDTQVKLLAKTAAEPHDCVELSRLSLKHGRVDDAKKWLQEATELSQRGGGRFREHALDEQEIAILRYQKKFDQALQLRWKHFQRQPDLEYYRYVREMAKQAKDKTDWYDKSVKYLQAGNKKDRYWNKSDLITQLHLEEKKPELALSLAEKNKIDPAILLTVIRANKKQPERILPLYIRLAEYRIGLTNNDAYREAIVLLKEAKKNMQGEQREILHKEIARLHNDYKAKRNFKKMLEATFGAVLGV